MSHEEAEGHLLELFTEAKDLLLLSHTPITAPFQDAIFTTLENHYMTTIIDREFGTIAIYDGMTSDELNEQCYCAIERIYGAIRNLED